MSSLCADRAPFTREGPHALVLLEGAYPSILELHLIPEFTHFRTVASNLTFQVSDLHLKSVYVLKFVLADVSQGEFSQPDGTLLHPLEERVHESKESRALLDACVPILPVVHPIIEEATKCFLPQILFSALVLGGLSDAESKDHSSNCLPQFLNRSLPSLEIP